MNKPRCCENCIYGAYNLCSCIDCDNCPNFNGKYCYCTKQFGEMCDKFTPVKPRVRVNPAVIDGKFEMSQKDYDKIIASHGYTGYYQYDVNIKETGKKYGVRVGFFDKRFYRNKFYITVEEGNYEILD